MTFVWKLHRNHINFLPSFLSNMSELHIKSWLRYRIP